MKTHRKQWKQNQVQLLLPLFEKYSTIAVGELSGVPSLLVQKLRKNLHGKATVRVSKTRVIKKALGGLQEKKPVFDLVGKSCILVFSELDAFELFSVLKKNQTKAFAKEGFVAEEDILVPAGDTGLPPGPALSELKAAGLVIKIQGQTISVVSDKVVTRKGERVSKPVAGVLAKLDIKPVKIGLKVSGIFSKGVLFGAHVLDIDSEKVFNDFCIAFQSALNLSFNSRIFNKASVPLLVGKAFNDSKTVALEAGFLTTDTLPFLLAKTLKQAKAIEGLVQANKKQ